MLLAVRTGAPPRSAPVEFSLPVAADATGDGTLDISGGSSGDGSGDGPQSFDALLAALRNAPRNDDVKVQLSLSGGGGSETPSPGGRRRFPGRADPAA